MFFRGAIASSQNNRNITHCNINNKIASNDSYLLFRIKYINSVHYFNIFTFINKWEAHLLTIKEVRKNRTRMWEQTYWQTQVMENVYKRNILPRHINTWKKKFIKLSLWKKLRTRNDKSRLFRTRGTQKRKVYEVCSILSCALDSLLLASLLFSSLSLFLSLSLVRSVLLIAKKDRRVIVPFSSLQWTGVCLISSCQRHSR